VSPAAASLQTVISVIILVIFCIGFSAFMVISCVKQYRSPTHRIDGERAGGPAGLASGLW
jgi:hypothetical protein